MVAARVKEDRGAVEEFLGSVAGATGRLVDRTVAAVSSKCSVM